MAPLFCNTLTNTPQVRRQFNTTPGLMEGTARPDYSRCVEISTDSSLREMIAPGALVMLTPVIAGRCGFWGWLWGVGWV